ncbi:hypothetical protein KE423_003906 [Salmonella enterica]|nr:hypothetical protein [Salmonella enterica]
MSTLNALFNKEISDEERVAIAKAKVFYAIRDTQDASDACNALILAIVRLEARLAAVEAKP